MSQKYPSPFRLPPQKNPDTDRINELLIQDGLEPTRQNRRRFRRQVTKDLKKLVHKKKQGA